MPDPALTGLCEKHGIQLEAYSPLAKGAVLEHPVVREIALESKRSPAQVALQYLLQKNISAVFTASKEEWMRENVAILHKDRFRMSDHQMRRLDMVSVACNRTSHTLLAEA